MLHGMIPAAFFATLMRRYLDSLAETPEYFDYSSTMASCLGTSAVVATAGFAVYGLTRLKKNTPLPEIKQLTLPVPENNDPPYTIQFMKRKPSRSKIRKRRRKGKQWFLKNMRHYKSKYGQRIGKLINQLLGKPFTESPVEPIDTDDSDDECPEVFQNSLYEDDSESDYLKNSVQQNIADHTFPDDFPCRLSNTIEEDSIAAAKDDFEDVDEDTELTTKRSSSLDLKDLLRENFERQKMRQRSRRGSSVSSGNSRRSSKSHNSSKSDSHHSRSSSRNSRASRKRSTHGKYFSRREGNREWKGEGRLRGKSFPKKTRSGRCYHKMTS